MFIFPYPTIWNPFPETIHSLTLTLDLWHLWFMRFWFKHFNLEFGLWFFFASPSETGINHELVREWAALGDWDLSPYLYTYISSSPYICLTCVDNIHISITWGTRMCHTFWAEQCELHKIFRRAKKRELHYNINSLESFDSHPSP